MQQNHFHCLEYASGGHYHWYEGQCTREAEKVEEGSCSGGHQFRDKETANESLQFCEELVLLYRLAGTYLAEGDCSNTATGCFMTEWIYQVRARGFLESKSINHAGYLPRDQNHETDPHEKTKSRDRSTRKQNEEYLMKHMLSLCLFLYM